MSITGRITLGGSGFKARFPAAAAATTRWPFVSARTTTCLTIRCGKTSAWDGRRIQRRPGGGGGPGARAAMSLSASLEQGYDTMSGRRRRASFGGERQRIAIARAMLKDAPVVILDEATAYIDPENEAVIQQAVARLVKGKTVIVIAHRLSTITDADQIFVVEKGRIAAKGTHKELLASSGLYRAMWNAHIGAKDGETV